MTSFTLVDGIVLGLIAISAILAYARGFVREVMSIVGWVAAAAAGFAFAGFTAPLVREIPVLRDVIGTSCELSILVAFAIVFAIALVIVSLFTPLLSGWVQDSAIGPVDQGLGLLFGVGRGVLLVVVALVVYQRIFGATGGVDMVDNSRSKAMFIDLEARIAAALPEDSPQWIEAKYTELTSSCQ